MDDLSSRRESLSRLLGTAARLPPARAARIAAGILGGLGAAPHGRLDPEHVLVEGDAVDVLPPAAARHRAEYQAPEQALGEAIDGRTDVFAVGVMLYEMLAGKRPFEGKTPGELVSALLVRDAAPLKDVPEALAEVVRKALAKKAGERWGSAGEMKAALENDADADAHANADADDRPRDVRDLGEAIGGTVPMAAVERAPAPVVAAVARPRPKYPRLAVGVGAAFLIGLVGWIALRPADRAPAGTAPASLVAKLRATAARGELSAARAQAESLAKGYPRDPRAFALLGDMLFTQGEKERALAAYREAQRLDPAVGSAPELLANLRATFPDPQHGEAAFRLAEAIGAPAEPILSDLAAHTSEARLKRRAAEAMGRIHRGDKSP